MRHQVHGPLVLAYPPGNAADWTSAEEMKARLVDLAVGTVAEQGVTQRLEACFVRAKRLTNDNWLCGIPEAVELGFVMAPPAPGVRGPALVLNRLDRRRQEPEAGVEEGEAEEEAEEDRNDFGMDFDGGEDAPHVEGAEGKVVRRRGGRKPARVARGESKRSGLAAAKRMRTSPAVLPHVISGSEDEGGSEEGFTGSSGDEMDLSISAVPLLRARHSTGRASVLPGRLRGMAGASSRPSWLERFGDDIQEYSSEFQN
eukprot:gb/GEZN01010024.1/.p1 GENE.gb/GEZN01010024.1/~~gb/GEZN01010024.1/.p1  ORF type:complete len:257 (-),score=49.03 gb/GEZN01010024.1/:269-1039(-)